MPYIIKHNPKGGWDIIRKNDGSVAGHSSNMKDAKTSMRIRMEAHSKKAQGK